MSEIFALGGFPARWSGLAQVPANLLRIGLGAAGAPAALATHLAAAPGRRSLRDANETV